MSTTASLDSTSVSLDPGTEAVIPLQIRNNGEIVEGYRIEVVGAPAAWAVVDPPDLSLYPGTSTTATVTFRPPRSASVPAGEQRFGVVVTPTEHPDEAVVPEGVVEILPFLETVAELVPRTSQGRRRGRHQVALDNRSNVPVTAVIEGTDEGRKVRFRIDPPALSVPSGEAAFASVKVRPSKQVWWGQPITHPFSVIVTPQDSISVALDGTHVQQPVIPRWLPKLLLALLGLLLALLVLWFVVLKPAIEEQARQVAEEAVAEEVAAAQGAAEQAAAGAGAAQQSAGDAQEAADTAQDLVGLPPTPRTIVAPFAERLNVVTGGSGVEPFDVEDESVLKLSDLVLSNPQGDFGRLQLLVDGSVKLEVALENFRDLDYHFVSPLTVTDEIVLSVQCNTPGQPPDAPPTTRCDIAALLGGEMTSPAPDQ